MSTADRFLGRTAAQAAALLQRVVTASTDLTSEDAVARLFALTAFAALAEPGDTDACLLIDLLAAETALALVQGDAAGSAVLDRLGEHAPLDALPSAERLDAALGRWRGRRDQADPAGILERAAHLRARLVTPDDPLWLHGMSDLERGRPLLLWTRGEPGRLAAVTRSIAMVGARAATGYGTHVAMESAAALSDRGFCIVSGGAYGIDAAAHRAAVASGQVTVAFLAGGVDRLYPTGNTGLLQRVIETGLVVSELPPGSAPTRWRFLMRNRLIAAASQATIVIEAGRRSGSLNTAGHAAQLGRPLGAVPGPVTSPGSAGCHRLIREYDATCVTTPDEMAELCEPLGEGIVADGDSRERSDELLGELRIRAGRTIRELMTRTGQDAARVQAELGRLEALGRVRESGDGWHRVVE